MAQVQQAQSYWQSQANLLRAIVPLWVGVAAQLTISHILAGLMVIALLDNDVSLGPALLGGTITGLVLTLTLQRTLWLLESALIQLQMGQTAIHVSRRWHGPLNVFAARCFALIEQAGQVVELRENLVGQVRDTAAQQERNRLARELHDSIKQQIFSISMSAAAALNLVLTTIVAIAYVTIPDPDFSRSPTPMTMASFLNSIYGARANILLWMTVGAAVIVGIVSLLTWIGVRLSTRGTRQSIQTQTVVQ